MATHLTHRRRITLGVERSDPDVAPEHAAQPCLATWPSYDPGQFYDEMVGPRGEPRPAVGPLWRHFAKLGPEELAERQQAADREMRAIGVTFTVCEGSTGVDRPWPFDIIPRVIPAEEWRLIESGLVQRLSALNLFIDDVYHDQRSVSSGVVPSELVAGSPNFHRECVGVDPPGGIWAHICGSDLIRDADGTVYVLEDNLRVPSGVSYLLENRMVAKHVFPEMFRHYSIEPVDPYVGRLANLLSSVSPAPGDPTIVVLTPGIYNSAYFEHAFLAQQLGVELVEGSDLVVLDDDAVYARTIDDLQRVDVIYRRIDDLFLDPEVFRPDSMLGVPGLIRAWRAGRVALVNVPGAGIADDKKVYSYVPDIIRFFLDEEPILATVPTLRCSEEKSLRFVMENIERLVVKPANESGGYGVLVGSQATPGELAHAVRQIGDDPKRWVAQPVVPLSTAQTLCGGEIAPRHVDLRPFTLLGPEGAYVTRGGLTRVARNEGLTGGQLLPGRREQGHLGGRRLASRSDRAHGDPCTVGRRTRAPAGPMNRQVAPAPRLDPPHDLPKERTMLLARMAEAVYWAGRYLERAEGTARIVQVHTDTHFDLPVGEDVGWEPLLAVVGVHSEFAERYSAAVETGDASVAEEDVIEFLLHGEGNGSSILASVTAARESFRRARPVVPREAWEACNNLWLACTDHLDEAGTRQGRVQWLRRVVAGCQRINGILLGTMSRDEAISFLSIGQNLERADLTTRVLDVRSESLHPKRGDDPYDVVHWMAVLRSLAAYQPFRRAMPARPQGGSTLRFLLQDVRFPRAVSACLTEVRSHLKELARSEGPLDACANASMVVASAAVPRLTLGGLDEFLDEVQSALAEIDLRLDETYFRPSFVGWQVESVPS